MTHRYTIACVWGDIAEADTYDGALLARQTLAAEHRPDLPTNLKGITILDRGGAVFPDGPTSPAEYRAAAETSDEPLRTWLLDQATALERRGIR